MTAFTHVRQELHSKGEIVPVSDIEKFIKNRELDYYSNLFTFNDEVVSYFKNNNNSIAGYEGKASTNKLVFDLDSVELKEVFSEASQLLAKLEKAGVNLAQSVKVYFSGQKGLHIEVATAQEFTPIELKSICSNFAEGLKTFDTSIYSLIRALRIVNTKHQKSGLYKIRIPLKDLSVNNIDKIKELAKEPRDIGAITTPTNIDFTKYINVTKSSKSVIYTGTESDEGIRGLDDIDFSKCPKAMPRCYFALSKGIAQPGERSRVFFILAKYYRNQGYEKEVTHRILKGISELNHFLYPEATKINKDEIWQQHVASAYSTSSLKHQAPNGTGTATDNALLLKYCNAIKSDCKCSLHKAQPSIMKIEDVSDIFESYTSDLDKNIVRTGIDCIDNVAQLTVGTVNLLIGSVAGGKTTMALNILQNSNKMNQPAMFFSMDMHRTLVYQKLAQMSTVYSSKEIQQFYKTKNKTKIAEIKTAIANNFKHTYFDFSSSMSLEEMEEKIKSVEEREGTKIKLVIVDYAGRMTSNYADDFANARFNATRSTGIADSTRACWLYLCQISRQVGDAQTPLRSSRAAKDSSAWEEAASCIFTVWRPWANVPDRDTVMRLYTAKNRMGKQEEFILGWDGAAGYVGEMSEEMLENYKMEWAPQEPGLKTRK